MNNKIEERACFSIMSNSVNVQLQRKLCEISGHQPDHDHEFADEHNKLPIGIEATATPLAMAVVRLYSRNAQGKFKEANLDGIFCFVVDRRLKTRQMRLYDINTFELTFQAEIYLNFAD